MSEALEYDDLAAALSRLGYRDDAATLHGAICGALCRRKPEDIDPVNLLDESDAPPDAKGRATLTQLLDQALISLSNVETGFMPLLPEDDIGLAERARSLAAWCEGFLFGLAGQAKLDFRACSEEVREIVRDFSQFMHAGFGDSDDLEVEEGAYAELVEYVRVGAQLVYMELHPRDHGSDSDTPTLH
jgi:uncharacterized protein YgfB (UPF0149 family)